MLRVCLGSGVHVGCLPVLERLGIEIAMAP